MKHYLILSILLLFYANLYNQNTASITGSVSSLNNAPLPRADIIIEPWNGTTLFNDRQVTVKPDGKFNISISKEGLYRVTVYGVLHKSIRFPLWIRQPGTQQIAIRMDPKNLDDGQYFDRDEYLSWIRVTGNFNGYNYDRGIPFKRVNPKTLKATITTSLDTIRYQVVGLTSGTTVLPDAESYALRDGTNYEAIVPVKDNTVVLTYKADSTYYPDKNPYEGYRTTWDPNQSDFTFLDTTEHKIHKNLKTESYFSRLFKYSVFDSDSLPEARFVRYMTDINKELRNVYIKELQIVEDQLRKAKEFKSKALLHSFYYKYMRLAKRIKSPIRLPGEQRDLNFDSDKYINSKIVEASLQILPPHSPLWSLNIELINVYTEILGYRPNVISYLESVGLQNPDQNLTGKLLLHLFTWSYDTEGNSDRTKKYYRYILDRFGDEYYARKAREYVQQNE